MKEPTTVDETTLSLKATSWRVVIAESLGFVVQVSIFVLFLVWQEVPIQIGWIAITALALFIFVMAFFRRDRDAHFDGVRVYGPGVFGRVSGEIYEIRRRGIAAKLFRLRQRVQVTVRHEISATRESFYLEPWHYEPAEFDDFVQRLLDSPAWVKAETGEAQSSV